MVTLNPLFSSGFNGAALVGAEEHRCCACSRARLLALQWGRSGWSGRTGRQDRGRQCHVCASMGPLWLERKNLALANATAMADPGFNGAALVGAEEPGAIHRSLGVVQRFNGAALVGAEEPERPQRPTAGRRGFNGAALVGAEEPQ